MEHELDPSDGLPIAEVGEWTLEKHERLRKYVDITRQARRKYIDPARDESYRGGATYIDLFCGPGRARIRESRTIIDGSPLVACKAAIEGKYPFSEIHLADVEASYSSAAVARARALGVTAFGYVGRSEETAEQVVARLNPHGLHFAFLDPFNLESLSFSTISSLAKSKRVDMLLHVSVLDLQRNLSKYMSPGSSVLEAFVPGWRDQIDISQSEQAIRAAIFQFWQKSLHALGFALPRGAELVTGSKNKRLYWLVFLSRHKIANEFWEKIRHISGQGDMLDGL